MLINFESTIYILKQIIKKYITIIIYNIYFSFDLYVYNIDISYKIISVIISDYFISNTNHHYIDEHIYIYIYLIIYFILN